MMKVKLPREVNGQELADAVEHSIRQIKGWGITKKRRREYVSSPVDETNPIRETEVERSIRFGSHWTRIVDIFVPYGFQIDIDTTRTYNKSEGLCIDTCQDGLFRTHASKLRSFVNGLYERLQNPVSN